MKQFNTLALGILAALCLLASAPSNSETVRFKQDRFAIGLWVEPPLDENADKHYRMLSDANFTFVIGGFGANDLDKVKLQYDLCKKYDLKVISYSQNTPADQLPESEVCWGYSIRDEPSAKDFPKLGERVAEIRKARPGKLGYINLFPNYASSGALGTDTYDEHVDRFIKEVNPDVLSMDYYPIFKPDTDGRDGYCVNLDVMRKYSLQAGIPFWNFFNIMPYGPHTDPTESQVRWQIYTSLAYGAKGVMYFCYWTPRGGEFPKGGAIIRVDGTPTRHYDQATRINAEIKNLGPTLMKLTSSAVLRIASEDDPAKVLEGSPLKDLKKDEVDPAPNYLVGSFKHEDGRRAVLINNYHFAYAAWPTVVFDGDPGAVREISKQDGTEIPLYDESPDMEGFQLSLDAGEGRLFLLP